MLVRDVMSSPAITVHENATVKDAIELLDQHSIAAMPVVDDSGRLTGVVSEADVIREMVVPDQRAHEIPLHLSTTPSLARVADVMTTHALTITSDTDLEKAADLLTSTMVKSLPVVDHGHVVGVVSRRDIIRLLSREDPQIEAEIDDLFRQAGKDWMVDVQDGVATLDGPSDDAEQRLAQALAYTVRGVTGIQFRSGRAASGQSPDSTGTAV